MLLGTIPCRLPEKLQQVRGHFWWRSVKRWEASACFGRHVLCPALCLVGMWIRFPDRDYEQN